MPEDMPRTVCGCELCRVGCRTMPGSLIPSDLPRIQAHAGDTSAEFLMEHFEVSEGTVVAKIVNGVPVMIDIPSIVPAQRKDGSCVFLARDGHCQIHAVSPFGCSRHDSHMDDDESDRRSRFAVTEMARSHQLGDEYSQLCRRLAILGRVSRPIWERKWAFRDESERVLQEQGLACAK